MYKKVDFSKLGGFPLTQNTMNFLQDSYNNVLEALSRSIGNYVIISGVTQIDAGVWSEGWLSYDNKIVPFLGGNELNFVKIVSNTGSLTFKNQVVFPVYTGYSAIFDSNEGIPFSSFQRLSLTSLKQDINTTNTLAEDAYNLALSLSVSAIPAGVIVMWSGTVPPLGWGLCDGSPGRPDLRGRFIVGYNPSDVDYDNIGKTGGLKNVTLTINQMPSHNHTMQSAGDHQHFVRERDAGNAGVGSSTDEGVNDWNGSGTIRNTSFAGTHTHTINNTGLGQSHENRPPYYTLAYIIKL